MSIVLCRLPKAGLGNQLFPLLKAYLFSDLNNLPVKVVGYNQFKIGPYLRRSKTKRNYRGYFVFEKGMLQALADKYILLLNRNLEVSHEPGICKVADSGPKQLYVFSRLPHWSDYFHELKDHRERVLTLFMNLLSTPIKEQYADATPPVIGIHIRMGDFRKLMEGEDFSSVGVVRTPLDYFIDVIRGIRNINGNNLPVSVFTDGYKHELQELFQLSNIQLVEGNPDIVDLLLLSKSRIIVTSAGSTFSYWAGFLSDSPLIMHPAHIHSSIRPYSSNERVYEGAFDAGNPLLISNIKAIR